MVQALGYSLNPFAPDAPGRLCRGRERWIEPFDVGKPVVLQRLVISGAEFTDDSAHDARRGLRFSGISLGDLMEALFPGQPIMAFCEQGVPGLVPEGASMAEEYSQPRCGGRRVDRCVRWRVALSGPEALSALFGESPSAADGFLPLPAEPGTALEDAVYLLTGFGERAALPMRRFQPAALPILLEQVPWVACIHMDKHAPSLGIYSRELPDLVHSLEALAFRRGIMAVPFSIPPMLARWDRALYELRLTWRERGGHEFPVPPSDEGGGKERVASYEREE